MILITQNITLYMKLIKKDMCIMIKKMQKMYLEVSSGRRDYDFLIIFFIKEKELFLLLMLFCSVLVVNACWQLLKYHTIVFFQSWNSQFGYHTQIAYVVFSAGVRSLHTPCTHNLCMSSFKLEFVVCIPTAQADCVNRCCFLPIS